MSALPSAPPPPHHHEHDSSPDYGMHYMYDPQSDIESGRENGTGTGTGGYRQGHGHGHGDVHGYSTYNAQAQPQAYNANGDMNIDAVAIDPHTHTHTVQHIQQPQYHQHPPQQQQSIPPSPRSVASSPSIGAGGIHRSSLRCTLDSSAILYDILHTLLLDRDQRCTITLMSAGLKFTVSKSNSVCAKVYMKKATFVTYHLRADAEHSRFDISCSTLLQCLSIFGKDSSAAATTHVAMEWADVAEPLRLQLEDQGTIMECSIPTFEYVAIYDTMQLS
jgi:hypothetical protein